MADGKKLYRSRNAWLGGVCGGIAGYFGWDPTVVRLIYLLLTFSSLFSGIPIYIILWILIPAERTTTIATQTVETRRALR